MRKTKWGGEVPRDLGEEPRVVVEGCPSFPGPRGCQSDLPTGSLPNAVTVTSVSVPAHAHPSPSLSFQEAGRAARVNWGLLYWWLGPMLPLRFTSDHVLKQDCGQGISKGDQSSKLERGH